MNCAVLQLVDVKLQALPGPRLPPTSAAQHRCLTHAAAPPQRRSDPARSDDFARTHAPQPVSAQAAVCFRNKLHGLLHVGCSSLHAHWLVQASYVATRFSAIQKHQQHAACLQSLMIAHAQNALGHVPCHVRGPPRVGGPVAAPPPLRPRGSPRRRWWMQRLPSLPACCLSDIRLEV
jgi:hypothetical protein